MVALVLCEASDTSAGWAAAGLRARGVDTVLATAAELECALQFTHALGDDHITVDVSLPGGRRWSGSTVTGVLNRLQYLPSPEAPGLTAADRDYAREEFNALTLSWLAGVARTGCPFIGLPHAAGLSGEWRYRSEWLLLAHSAGLRPAPLLLDTSQAADVASAPAAFSIAVVCGEVAGFLTPDHRAGVLRLASILGTDVLTVWFDAQERVVGSDLLPDLRLTGSRGLDAMASRITHRTMAGANR